MAIVRLLFLLAMGAIAVSLVLWLVKRDPQYLRFVLWVAKLTLAAALGVLLWYAADRLWLNPPSIKARAAPAEDGQRALASPRYAASAYAGNGSAPP